MTSDQLASDLAEKLRTFDRNSAEEICQQVTTQLYSSDAPFDPVAGEKMMQDLRGKRLFDLMEKLGDAFISTDRATGKIQRLYLQALIDLNYLTAARCYAEQLIVKTDQAAETDRERAEAKGLLGRIFKQLYLQARKTTHPSVQNFLRKAIEIYYNVYAPAPQVYTWHGINAVALLARAEKDGIEITGFARPEALARAILNVIQMKYETQTADAFDFATAAEACIALQDAKNALEWISGYARWPYADAFELGSTLRQLQEVWQLDMNSETGKLVLPILRAELLKREGGSVTIDHKEVPQQTAIAETYKQLITETPERSKDLEKVFGTDSFVSYEWYKTGLDRCYAVARIGRNLSEGLGTGFLLEGSALHQELGPELVLLTNAHVISSEAHEGALHIDEAVIVFEGLDKEEKFRASKIIWSSPSTKLDATLLRFDKENHSRLKELTKALSIYPLSTHLPAINEQAPQRIYIIGHPRGGSLRWSLQDNILLDHEDPRLHYRTPTVGGSSGSPVFNQQWELIGLHHAGSNQMQRLRGKEGTYEANEGIWIGAIKKALQQALKAEISS